MEQLFYLALIFMLGSLLIGGGLVWWGYNLLHSGEPIGGYLLMGIGGIMLLRFVYALGALKD